MERKYKQRRKEGAEEECLGEVEKLNYKTALEAKKKLDSIIRTTERTGHILSEQGEKLEEIRDETETIQQNIKKGDELTVQLKRAGKLISFGDKIGDTIKNIFKPTHAPKPKRQPRQVLKVEDMPEKSEFVIEEEPTEDSTNQVLLSIRDGLQNLRESLKQQNKEINEQLPVIEDITKTNKAAAQGADKVIKNLKKI